MSSASAQGHAASHTERAVGQSTPCASQKTHGSPGVLQKRTVVSSAPDAQPASKLSKTVDGKMRSAGATVARGAVSSAAHRLGRKRPDEPS